ncbi:MFS transporter [Spirulina sp. 06S082]|uniref:MFS transporter n=1 Tax=Spirulina sp. 06S082 TaxID=3110248 RepID=UPI002B200D8B|nr:MFS transporter [Spirulina sp. 06S082]MEA5471171.1 MFS transporter [Spirulina sp. 06S082]
MMKRITLLLISTMTVMAGATISPALPQIEAFFQEVPHADFWVKLMLTIPALFTAIAAPFVGIIIDRFGRKPLLVAATLLYGAAGGSGLILSTLPLLLGGRALLGLSVAAIMTTATTLIADYYAGPQREQVMGLQAAFVSYGGGVFLILGGILADISWRFPFAIYLMAFALCGLVILFIVEPQRDTEAESLSLLDRDAPMPVLPVPLVMGIYAMMFVSMVAFYLVPVQLPFYLQALTSVSNAWVGVAIASLTLASAIASMNYRRIKSQVSFTGIMVFVYVLMGLGYGVIAIAQTYLVVLLGLLLAGLGLGLLMPNVNVWLSAKVPPATRGRVLGGLTSCMFLGQFSSPIISQPFVQKMGLAQTYGSFGIALSILAAGLIFLSLQAKQKT